MGLLDLHLAALGTIAKCVAIGYLHATVIALGDELSLQKRGRLCKYYKLNYQFCVGSQAAW